MYKRKKTTVAIAPNANKRRWTPFYSRLNDYTVDYNAWLSFTADTSITERQQEDVDAQLIRFESVYRHDRAPTASLVSMTIKYNNDREALSRAL